MAVALKFAVMIFVLFNIRKEYFASANSVCFSFNGENVEDVENSRICASIWAYKQEKGTFVGHNSQNHAGLQLLLLLAGDVEMCLGHSMKCFSRKKPIRKNQSSENCFICG